jgi:GNAT superfamily N-acetyltransferase
MCVRGARLPQDEAAILAFIRALQEYESGFEPDRRTDPAFAAEHWHVVQKRHAESGGIFLIAEEVDVPVGWAFAHDAPGPVFVIEAERRHGSIAELFVTPKARGRGHGRTLIQACEAWGRGRGYKLLTIGVLAKNARAIRAYEGAGYDPYTVVMRRYL